MTLVNEMAPFLDPQMVLDLINFADKHGNSNSNLNSLKLEALEATLRAEDYLAAGGDSTKANEMRTQAAQLKEKNDANSLYAAGQYKESLEALATGNSANAWGEYATNIMLGRYEAAAAVLPAIQEQVETKSSTNAPLQSSLSQLNMRAWFVHWALFSLFRIDEGRDKLVEYFCQTQCMTTIQAACPWVLRYLAVAVVLGLPSWSPLQSKRFKDLVRAIVQESYEYTDPVLDFIAGLAVHYQDVPTLATKLASAQQLLSQDYFCEPFVNSFVKNSRALIIASYTKTHTKISIETLANNLSISQDQVLELLKNANVISACSTAANIYLVSHTRPSLDETINDKIKAINQRAAAALSQAQSKHEK